jgi:hypothetical protein
MSFAFHQFKKKLTYLTVSSARTLAFCGAVLAGGLMSSCYAVNTGTALTTQTYGPWVTWVSAGQQGADPYTRAHYAALGALPLSSETAQLYTARTDSDGRRLHSSCDYAIEGRTIPYHWWSVSVFDDAGRMIANAAERYTFTSDTIGMKADGSYAVSLARDARPENWLPTGGAGRLAVTLQVLDLGVRAVARDDDSVEKALPKIRRISCR